MKNKIFCNRYVANTNQDLGVQIRSITPKDSDQVYDQLLKLAKFGNARHLVAMSKKQFDQYLFSEFKVWQGFVAEYNNQIIGNVIYTISTLPFFYNGTNSLHIIKIFVEQEYRKFKLGNKLLAEVKSKAKELNINLLELIVFKDNKVGNKFYDKEGFSNLNYLNIRRLKLD